MKHPRQLVFCPLALCRLCTLRYSCLLFSLLLLILPATAVLPTVAWAHTAALRESDPPADAHVAVAPEKVTLWFVEELLSDASHVAVYDAAGVQVDHGDGGLDLHDPDHASLVASLPPTLSTGVYTVRWQATLVDGDVTASEFRFAVGEGVLIEPLPAQSTMATGQNFMVMWIGALLIGASGLITLMLRQGNQFSSKDTRKV